MSIGRSICWKQKIRTLGKIYVKYIFPDRSTPHLSSKSIPVLFPTRDRPQQQIIIKGLAKVCPFVLEEMAIPSIKSNTTIEQYTVAIRFHGVLNLQILSCYKLKDSSYNMQFAYKLPKVNLCCLLSFNSSWAMCFSWYSSRHF